MANTVPASLKAADISRFAHRAAQLEKPKPAIAYWCNYWILNQLLAKNLHNVDSEALSYTTGLMDKVEQFKSANSTNDAIIDEVAGKAYIEQFGLEIFSKADNAVRTNKVTTATADTFQAAATILEILAIWPPLEPEITAKVKYAKFHAVRILKAVKAGEDPNLSNPKPEPEPEELLPQLDPNDAEVRALEGVAPTGDRRASVVEIPDEADGIQANLARTSSLDQSLHPSREQSQARPPRPSVTEVPDEADRTQRALARTSTHDESLHPSRVPSRPTSGTGNVSPPTPHDAASFYSSNQHDISPMGAPSERKPSIGGNYFPVVSNDAPRAPVPTGPSQSLGSPFDLPSAPSETTLPHAPNTFTSQTSPSTTALFPPSNLSPDNHFMAPPPSGQTPHIPPVPPPQSTPHQQMPPAPPQFRQAPPPQAPPPTAPQQRPHQTIYAPPTHQPQPPPPVVQPYVQPPVQSNVVVDEEAMMKAQKHARWAISALNFEDVPTAIRELQGALASLGAR